MAHLPFCAELLKPTSSAAAMVPGPPNPRLKIVLWRQDVFNAITAALSTMQANHLSSFKTKQLTTIRPARTRWEVWQEHEALRAEHPALRPSGLVVEAWC